MRSRCSRDTLPAAQANDERGHKCPRQSRAKKASEHFTPRVAFDTISSTIRSWCQLSNRSLNLSQVATVPWRNMSMKIFMLWANRSISFFGWFAVRDTNHSSVMSTVWWPQTRGTAYLFSSRGKLCLIPKTWQSVAYPPWSRPPHPPAVNLSYVLRNPSVGRPSG